MYFSGISREKRSVTSLQILPLPKAFNTRTFALGSHLLAAGEFRLLNSAGQLEMFATLLILCHAVWSRIALTEPRATRGPVI